MSGPKYAVGEGLDGPGQIGEADAAVDHQPLDLVERRDVAGVGRVAAIALARHHRVDGQRRVAHCLSIRRTCTGEVWVRSMTVSGSPSSR